MSAGSERHNDLVTEFILQVIGLTIKAGGGYAEVLVLMESMMLGCLLTNECVFVVTRAASAEMLDTAANAVAARLTALPPGGR
jgi:hypothetical protein